MANREVFYLISNGLDITFLNFSQFIWIPNVFFSPLHQSARNFEPSQMAQIDSLSRTDG